MRIAVIGAGGVGGGFGAAIAKAGGDVTFVARGAHLAAMRENGLRVEGDRGETLIRPVQATDDPASIGPVDIVLFCVKLWDIESAGEQIKPLIGPSTGVIPLQNGIDAMQGNGMQLPAITVTVRTMKKESVAQVTIQDNGPGVKKEYHQRLFEPFFTTKATGIGMGLAISRSLIEGNGGRLWIDPQEGSGATFHLTLPFAT